MNYLNGGGTAIVSESNQHGGHLYNVANDGAQTLRIDPRRNLIFDVPYDAKTGGVPRWVQRNFNYKVNGEIGAWGLRKYQGMR